MNSLSDKPALDSEIAFICRQPICAADDTLQAYELLFHTGESASDLGDDALAASTVLLNTFVEIGLDRVVGNKQAFVKLTREFLVGEHPFPSRPDLLVVEVPEDIEIDDELVSGVETLKHKGFTIVLNGFAYRPELEPLLARVDIVKIDLNSLAVLEMKQLCRHIRKLNVRMLAENIRSVDDFETGRSLGCELFQGEFVSRPHVLQRVKSKINKLVVLQLLNQMSAQQFSFPALAEVVKQDAGLSCCFLRYVNSAGNGRQIRSIDHALVMLGSKGIRGLTALLELSGMSDMPEQCVVSAVLRGNMCRLLAEKLLPSEADSLATLGILSTLDLLLAEPLERVISDLPITPQMRAAIISKAGIPGAILKAVVAYDTGDWPNARLEGVPKTVLRDVFLESLQRADEVVTSLMSKKR